MYTNSHSLLVIDNPYVLYVYLLMKRNEKLDILILSGEHYTNKELENFIGYVLPVGIIRNIIKIKESFSWNSIRNNSTIRSVQKRLISDGITDKKINSYDKVYLNSYTSAVSFYISTIRPYVAIQHATVDLIRHLPVYYFFESIKFFLRTKKIRYRYLQFCMANSLKHTPKNFVYYNPLNIFLENKFHLSYDLNKVFSKKKGNVGILLWVNHYSYHDPFDIKFINLNLRIFEVAYKDYKKNLDYLVIKLHHRIPRPNKLQFEKIKHSFKKFGFKIILFDNIFDYKTTHRLYPIEMFMNILKPSFISGACTAAIWNCSNWLTCKTYSALEYENSKVGRLKTVISKLKKVNTKLEYIPTDLTSKLNE